MNHNSGNKFLFIVLSVMLIPVFHTGSAKEKKLLARVNGKEIREDYFNPVYTKFLQDFRNFNPGSSLDENTQVWAKKYVLEEIVKRELVIQEAKKTNFSVSDAEVEAQIKESPAFRDKDGKFDSTKYLWTINNPDINWAQVRETTREELRYSKFVEHIMYSEKVSDEEILRMYKDQNEKMKVVYALVKTQPIPDSQIKDSDLNAYYKENKEKYRVPEKVKIKYLLVTPQKVRKRLLRQNADISLSEKEIAEKTKETAAQIAGKAGDLSGLETMALLFGGLAETPMFSYGSAVDTLGYGSRFNERAFSLLPGQVDTVPLELQLSPGVTGYAVMSAADKISSYIPSLEEVKIEAKITYRKMKEKDAARSKAAELTSRLMVSAQFETACRKNGYDAKSVILSRYDYYVDGLGYTPQLTNTSFESSPQEAGSIEPKQIYSLDINEGTVVYSPVERMGIDELAFSKEKENLKTMLTNQKGAKTFEKWYEGVRSQAKVEIYLDENPEVKNK